MVAAHVLVGSLITSNLHELHGTEHSDPDQLEDDPDIEDESEGVTGHNVTKRVINNIALGTGNWWQTLDV